MNVSWSGFKHHLWREGSDADPCSVRDPYGEGWLWRVASAATPCGSANDSAQGVASPVALLEGGDDRAYWTARWPTRATPAAHRAGQRPRTTGAMGQERHRGLTAGGGRCRARLGPAERRPPRCENREASASGVSKRFAGTPWCWPCRTTCAACSAASCEQPARGRWPAASAHQDRQPTKAGQTAGEHGVLAAGQGEVVIEPQALRSRPAKVEQRLLLAARSMGVSVCRSPRWLRSRKPPRATKASSSPSASDTTGPATAAAAVRVRVWSRCSSQPRAASRRRR